MSAESSPPLFGVCRGSDAANSVTSSLTGRTLPQPCTAALSSRPPSVTGGLTSASVASADTTLTLDSNASHVIKVHYGLEPTGAAMAAMPIIGATAAPMITTTPVTTGNESHNNTAGPVSALNADVKGHTLQREVASAADVPREGSSAEAQLPYQPLSHLRTSSDHHVSNASYTTTHTIQLPGPFVEHDDDAFPLSPLACGTSHLCCGPPPRVPSAEAERTTSAVNFLEDDLPPVTEPPLELLPTLSPEEDAGLPEWSGGRVRVPSSLAHASPLSELAAMTVDDGVTSPVGLATVSPTTCSTATTAGASLHGNRSFDAPLPNCSHFAATDDVIGVAGSHGRGRPAERRAMSLTDYPPLHPEGPGASLHAQQQQQQHQQQPPHCNAPSPAKLLHSRHSWPHSLSHADPSDSAISLSALTTPVTSTPTATTPMPVAVAAAVVVTVPSTNAARCSDDNNSIGGGQAAAGLLSARSLRNRTSPRSLSEGGATTNTTLPRVTSLDTVTTLSSTRSRPALTPAATGLVGTATSTAGSTTASTTMTSVTYTRKNVSLGALDFYGNPVTSLSTLLAQMSVRSGDRDEMEQLDLRHNPQQQQQQQQQQQHRNTLSMQNLKAHTQQVGVMGPEDKIKRLRVRSDTVSAPTASVLRRRRASCPASALGPSCASPTAATPAGKPQVGCLKDVLQECNFLCINDVINAIAETQVHELQEAQQQLEGGGGAATATNTTATTASAPETAPASPSLSSTTAAAAVVPTVAPAMEGKQNTGAAAGDVTSAAAMANTATTSTVVPGLPPTLQRTASLPMSAWSEEGCSPLTRGATASSFITAGLPTSADMIDPQHALSLAAAITEVSLNLDRASEVSSSMASNMAAVGAQRPHFLRAASGRTATCSMNGDGTTPSVTSGSLPNLAGEMPIAASHTSTVITPVQLRPTVSCSSHAPSSPADLSTPFAGVVAVFPEDPLERKVLRSSSSDAATEANRSTTSARSGETPATLSQPRRSTEVTPLKSAKATHEVSATSSTSGAAHVVAATLTAATGASTRPTATAADVSTRDKCSGSKTKGGAASPWLVLAGRYVPNWQGLSANGEGAMEAAAACGYTSPLKTPCRDDGDCLARSIIGDIEELRECVAQAASNSSQEPTGASNSVAEVRVMIDTIACASFDDELTTVRELRKWAKCVAQQEQLQPSTETEVTT